jgi:hypothetical protein
MTTTETEAVEPVGPGETIETVDSAASLVYLDPRALTANPANVRTNLGDLAPLAASIGSIGVVEPLVVVPDGEGGFRIVAGHRRNAAVISLDDITMLERPACVWYGLLSVTRIRECVAHRLKTGQMSRYTSLRGGS